MRAALNHVAILVTSLDSVLKCNHFSPDILSEMEEFPSEGTRELYVGRGKMGRLLLMQAIGKGPYASALERRGECLHHLALDVENIDEFVKQLSGSGWYLHPKSLYYYKNSKQVYLCRPGIPVVIEIQERPIFEDDAYFIKKVEFPFGEQRLVNSLHCDRISNSAKIKFLGDDDFEIFKLDSILTET
jgi:methylmalonyl-CoA/ethylmalonyl-CoA epimerase